MWKTAAAAAARDIEMDVDGLLYVELLMSSKHLALRVGRSIHVAVTGYLYAPVAAFLADFPHTLIFEQEYEKPDMCGGREIVSSYLIGGETPSRASAA